MNPIDAQLVDIARDFIAQAVRLNTDYERAQNSLELDRVLAPQNLSEPAGTAQSLETLTRFEAITQSHQDMFKQLGLRLGARIAHLVAALESQERLARQAELMNSINELITGQAAFYTNRARWVEAARAICVLINAHRATSTFGEEGVRFAEADTLDRFEALLETIEQTHRTEVIALEQRVATIARSLDVLRQGM